LRFYDKVGVAVCPTDPQAPSTVQAALSSCKPVPRPPPAPSGAKHACCCSTRHQPSTPAPQHVRTVTHPCFCTATAACDVVGGS
jgi:hypothetical protein